MLHKLCLCRQEHTSACICIPYLCNPRLYSDIYIPSLILLHLKSRRPPRVNESMYCTYYLGHRLYIPIMISFSDNLCLKTWVVAAMAVLLPVELIFLFHHGRLDDLLPCFDMICFVLSGQYHCNLCVCALLKPPREGSVIVIATVSQLW